MTEILDLSRKSRTFDQIEQSRSEASCRTELLDLLQSCLFCTVILGQTTPQTAEELQTPKGVIDGRIIGARKALRTANSTGSALCSPHRSWKSVTGCRPASMNGSGMNRPITWAHAQSRSWEW